MREIKFRAWDKDGQCMFEVSQLNFSPNIEGVIIDDLPRQKQLSLMQYTGLKDKNGKEIYEGDIVYETIWDKEQKKPLRYEIRWSESNSGFWIGTASPLTQGSAQDLEIIGNIYETPELLK